MGGRGVGGVGGGKVHSRPTGPFVKLEGDLRKIFL